LDIYIIDIDRLDKEIYDPEDYNLADQFYLHRDILRGCTTNWFYMKRYYDFLSNLTKGLVKLKTFKYTNIDIDIDAVGDVVDSGQLSTIALSLYNNGNPYDCNTNLPWTVAATMPVLVEQPLVNGDFLICSEAMNELFDSIHFTGCEQSIMLRLTYLFTELNNYIFQMQENKSLIEFREMILDVLPRLLQDPYDIRSRVTIDPCEMMKVWITSYEFLK
jgi:hypothetical protein